jgi:hypothetical protein
MARDRTRRRDITVAQLNQADETRRLRGTWLAGELEHIGAIARGETPAVPTLDGFLFEPRAVACMDSACCLERRVVPLSWWEDTSWKGASLVVALVDPGDEAKLDKILLRLYPMPFLEVVLVPQAAVEAAVRRIYAPAWRPPPRPSSRSPDAVLRRRVESAASTHCRTLRPDTTFHSSYLECVFDEEQVHKWSRRVVHGKTRDHSEPAVPCGICGDEPGNRRYVNIVPSPFLGGRPVFVLTGRGVPAAAPTICSHCAQLDWKDYEAHVAAVIRILGAGAAGARRRVLSQIEEDDLAAQAELDLRFRRRRVRVASARCDLCGDAGEGVRGTGMFACARCVGEAKQEIDQFYVAEKKAADEDARRKKARDEEANQPFPDVVRREARRVAAHLGARRTAALVAPPAPARPPGPRDAAWDDVRGWFAESPTSYVYMRSYRERAARSPPPADVVELVGQGLVTLLESVALNGYWLRPKGQLTGDNAVLGEAWPAGYAMDFLRTERPGPALRARFDEAIALLERVIAAGARYYEYDRPAYDDVTEPYIQLIKTLYDFRSPLASVLSEGALLLHGGSAEDRVEVVLEIQQCRSGGRGSAPFVVIGSGPGEVRLVTELGAVLVFIPDPLALSDEEQAYLFYRLAPGGSPQPTILGADDERRFREQAQRRMMEKLLPRLYSFEHDLRPELARWVAP